MLALLVQEGCTAAHQCVVVGPAPVEHGRNLWQFVCDNYQQFLAIFLAIGLKVAWEIEKIDRLERVQHRQRQLDLAHRQEVARRLELVKRDGHIRSVDAVMDRVLAGVTVNQ